MGGGNTAQAFSDIVRLMVAQRISIFPLAGAILFPGMHLPLHMFEDRYRALVNDAMARDRQIGMIQPRDNADVPALFDVGCLGRIVDVEALDDGRFNLVLQGIARFRMVEEIESNTPFRQIRAELEQLNEHEEVLASVERAALEIAARRFAELQGYQIDWDSIGRLDDAAFVNGVAQIAPFDPASKQALLECDGLSARAELEIQLMQFFGSRDGDENIVTLQ